MTPPPDPAVLVHTAALATYLDRRRRTRSPLGSSWQWAVGPLALGVCMSIVGIVVGSEVAALVAAGIALAVGGAVAAVWTFWMRRGDRYAFLLDTGVSERGGVVRVHLEQPATEVLTGAIVSRVCLRRIRSRGSRVSIWFDVVATVEVGIGSTRFDLAIPSACPPTCTIFGSEVDHWVRIMRPHDLRRRQGYLRRRSDRPLYIT